jgi:hypothetical protein
MSARPKLTLVSRKGHRRPQLRLQAIAVVAGLTAAGLFLGALLLRNELFSLADGKERWGGTLLLALATVGLTLAAVFLSDLVRRQMPRQTAWAEMQELEEEHLRPAQARERELRNQLDVLPSRPTGIGQTGANRIERIVADTLGRIHSYWSGQQKYNAAAAPDLRLERDELHASLRQQAARNQKELAAAVKQTGTEIELELPGRLADARREAQARIFPAPVLKGMRFPFLSYLAAALICLGAITAAVVYVTGVYPPYQETEQPVTVDPDAGIFEPDQGR